MVISIIHFFLPYSPIVSHLKAITLGVMMSNDGDLLECYQWHK